MNNPLLRRIASTAIAFLLLLYVGYQIYRSHYKSVQTETADYFTASDSVQVTGLAVRNETLLQNEKDGVIDYVLSNGDKVAKGGTVAQIYSSEQQVAAQHEMESVNNEIEQLEELETPGDTYAASADSMNEQIYQKISSLLGETVSGSFTSLSQSREELLYLLNERQIVTGETTDFSSRLKELQTEYSTLKEQAGTPLSEITSPASGYFISSTDGLETSIDFSKADSLTYDQVQTALKTTLDSDTSIGKICESYDWYFVFTVPSGQVTAFRQMVNNGTVSIQFPFVSNLTIPASVDAVNQSDADSSAAVILQCTYMNSDLASIRKETAQILIQQYTGIRVSSKSLHFETVSKTTKDKNGKAQTVKKEVSGVYVLNGNQINFREVVPLYSTDNYVICNPSPDEDDLMTDGTVKLHDEVVVEGTDLYDGKVIE